MLRTYDGEVLTSVLKAPVRLRLGDGVTDFAHNAGLARVTHTSWESIVRMFSIKV